MALSQADKTKTGATAPGIIATCGIHLFASPPRGSGGAHPAIFVTYRNHAFTARSRGEPEPRRRNRPVRYRQVRDGIATFRAVRPVCWHNHRSQIWTPPFFARAHLFLRFPVA